MSDARHIITPPFTYYRNTDSIMVKRDGLFLKMYHINSNLVEIPKQWRCQWTTKDQNLIGLSSQ